MASEIYLFERGGPLELALNFEITIRCANAVDAGTAESEAMAFEAKLGELAVVGR